MHQHRVRSRRFLQLYCGVALWGGAVAAGLVGMMRFEFTPGEGALGAAKAPAALADQQDNRLTLLMFVHAECPCSAASVEELSQLMAQVGDRLHATVLVGGDQAQSGQWRQSTTWRSAERIAGVQVRVDVEGRLATQLNAHTSGQIYLFDPLGRALFKGGITGSRGHAGDNDNLDALLAVIRNPSVAAGAVIQRPVFGCALSDSSPPAGPPREAKP